MYGQRLHHVQYIVSSYRYRPRKSAKPSSMQQNPMRWLADLRCLAALFEGWETGSEVVSLQHFLEKNAVPDKVRDEEVARINVPHALPPESRAWALDAC
eukprot:3901301-Amphidinium_carterae.1